MKLIKLMSIVLLSLFISNVYAEKTDENQRITLTDSKKIADATALNDAINSVSKKVTECVKTKLAPPEKCSCLYPTDVGNVKNKYEAALKNNPEWRDKLVFWTASDKSMGYSLSFLGIRKQVEMKCEK
jgi:hypothetical protein